MELKDLISELQTEIDTADMAADAGYVDEAREHLRVAKKLLDDEFVKD